MDSYIFEDELPSDISDEEYSTWFKKSWIEYGVRVGPRIHFSSKRCWCNPTLDYVDSETGNEVWVHNDI